MQQRGQRARTCVRDGWVDACARDERLEEVVVRHRTQEACRHIICPRAGGAHFRARLLSLRERRRRGRRRVEDEAVTILRQLNTD